MPFRAIIHFVAIGLFFCLSASSLADSNQQQWQQVDSYGQIKLYRSLVEREGTLPFKATTELPFGYERIVQLLLHAEHKPSWAPKLKKVKVHKTQDSNAFVYSEYYTTPWPFYDREFLLRGQVQYLADRVVFTAENGVEESLADEDHLRANVEVLQVSIWPVNAEQSRVEFIFSGDMGGWIPPFVKTIIQKKWPVRFLQAMEKELAGQPVVAPTARYQALVKKELPAAASPQGPGPASASLY